MKMLFIYIFLSVIVGFLSGALIMNSVNNKKIEKLKASQLDEILGYFKQIDYNLSVQIEKLVMDKDNSYSFDEPINDSIDFSLKDEDYTQPTFDIEKSKNCKSDNFFAPKTKESLLKYYLWKLGIEENEAFLKNSLASTNDPTISLNDYYHRKSLMVGYDWENNEPVYHGYFDKNNKLTGYPEHLRNIWVHVGYYKVYINKNGEQTEMVHYFPSKMDVKTK